MPLYQQAFTVHSHGGLFKELITEIGVSALILDDSTLTLEDERIYKTTALWDTGASASVITASTAKTLNLKPTGLTMVQHAGGSSSANTYMVDIFLPNRVRFTPVKVTECPDVVGSFGVIIGMDIITRGDFSFTNKNGNSVFSFKIPSTKETDFVEEINLDEKYRKIAESWKKTGNDKCPCGSGKKYKNCHGKE